MVKVTQIQMDYMKNPAGLVKQPQFSWMIDGEGERCCRQQAYQLQLARMPEAPGAPKVIVYDSGMIKSGESAHVLLTEGTLTLEPARKYYVRVRVLTKSDSGPGDTGFSDWSWFVTGLTEPLQWTGDFVSAESSGDYGKFNATLIRGSFEVQGKIREAYAYTTALGVYKYYLNGSRVGTDEMAPGWTSYNKRLMYQTWDIKKYLLQGENILGAMVGAGWYKGKMGFLERINNYGKQTAFLAQLVIRYEDGRVQNVCTDSHFKGSPGPIVFSDIYDGETYDARMEQDGWSCPGFDGRGWHPVEIVPKDKGILIPQPGCHVAMIDTLPATEIFTTPAGDLVVDFGQNMAGWVEIRGKGAPGAVFELNCFEALDADGNVYLDNLRGAKETIRYICRDDREFSWHPSFTFQGFRYAKIASFYGEPTAESFVAHTVHSHMERTGFFSCSEPALNQLWHNILWGMKSNFLDIPTDCPQRNERVGWTGDAQIFCRTASYLMNTHPFFAKWLKDVEADQTPEGGVPHVVPDLISGHEENDWLLSQGTHSAAGWADVAVLNPWNLYLTYGDQEILKAQYGSMKRWIEFMHTHAEDNIWNYRLQFGDWVALDAHEGSYFGATPNDLTCTAYYALSTRTLAKIAGILGNTGDAKKYEALYKAILKTFQERFFDSEGNMTAQTQTAHIIALYFGLVPEKYRKKTAQALVRLLKKENGHLVTGFVGTPYFCHALSQNGYLKEAYELLLKDDFPSWLYQVKMGATTVWEHWDGIRPDGSMWSPDMNSFNHYAYGAIGEWLYRVLAGLEIDESAPGYKRFIVQPHPGGGLTWAKASFKSVYGAISAGWELNEDEGSPKVRLKLHVPVNTEAVIRPYRCKAILNDGGIRFENSNGITEGRAGSGDYTITYVMQTDCDMTLSVKPGSSYFWRNDEIFFWLGDTAWLMFHKLTRSQIDLYLQNRAEKGFNVIQTVAVHHLPAVNAYGNRAFWDDKVTSPDVSKADGNGYWPLIDWTIERARQLGIYIALLPHWGNVSDRLTISEMESYVRFLIGRYKNAQNVIWLAGGDIRGDLRPGYWRAMGRLLKKYGQGQLISYHPFGRTSSLDFFAGEEWLDFHMFQSGHRTYSQVSLDCWDDTASGPYYGEDNWRYVRDAQKQVQIKPILDGEPSYEHIPQGLHLASEPFWTPMQVRRYGWWSVLAGAAGFTYGHNSIMQFYTGAEEGAFCVCYPWQDAIHAPAAAAAAHMARVMREIFSEVTGKALRMGVEPSAYVSSVCGPCENLLAGASAWKEEQRAERILAFAAGDYLLCYTYEGKEVTLKLPKNEELRAWWLDPASGIRSYIGHKNTSDALLHFTPPQGDFDHSDWLLIVRRERIHNLP
ncbi:MAG: family 78 glycoside hydrolase catalytic domain [Clostridiales bacterium]|nr:family 78 glycoside hydrolase catalytic domain [Clostridiales bacterium]